MAAISAAELDATWRQLERVPRPDLARALARAQELGAAAFKRKDYQGAYDHYNQAVTGLEYLARTGADATASSVLGGVATMSWYCCLQPPPPRCRRRPPPRPPSSNSLRLLCT